MKRESQKTNDSKVLKKYKLSALNFFESQKQIKQAQARYEEQKKQFYCDMEELFKLQNVDKTVTFEHESFDEEIVKNVIEVNRVQKSSVTFDANKLEKVLSKKICEDVIVKKYEITDMFGLICYLKECGVDPKIFKSFLSITKSVDVKELERLEELGKVSFEQLKGCYNIKYQNPYFTVGIKKMAR